MVMIWKRVLPHMCEIFNYRIMTDVVEHFNNLGFNWKIRSLIKNIKMKNLSKMVFTQLKLSVSVD